MQDPLAQITALLLLFYPLSDICTHAFNQDKENPVVSNKESGIRCKSVEYGGENRINPIKYARYTLGRPSVKLLWKNICSCQKLSCIASEKVLGAGVKHA